MIDEIGIKAGSFDLILRQITGQLVNDGADHFQMPEFFCACKRVKMELKEVQLYKFAAYISLERGDAVWENDLQY